MATIPLGHDPITAEDPLPGRMDDRPKVIQRARSKVQATYSGSSVEHLWTRLTAMDFINRGMLFAAVWLLCFFPFIIVVNALGGRSAVTGFVRRLGLNHQAAADVTHVFAPASSTSAALSGTGYVLFVLGGVAAAAAIQELYERAFGLEARGMKNLPHQLAWLGALIGGGLAASHAGPWIHHAAGPLLLGLIGLVVFGLFWWFSMWLLLAGRLRWRELLPGAIATAVYWVGMEAVFWLTFSNMVISNNKKYGPIGVVFAFVSYLIAIGVVIILGAVFGVVWRERRGSAGTP